MAKVRVMQWNVTSDDGNELHLVGFEVDLPRRSYKICVHVC